MDIEIDDPTSDSEPLDDLHRENRHLRSQLDRMTGDWLNHAYATAGTMKELQKKRKGFSVISSLQQELLIDTPVADIVERALRAAVVTLDLDRALVLAPAEIPGRWRTQFHVGFDAAGARELEGVEIELPPEALSPLSASIVNRSTPATPLVAAICGTFSLPFYIAHPVIADGTVELYLVAGRLIEKPPFYPALDMGDLETFRAIAGLIGTTIQNRNIARLREELLRAELARRTMMEHERSRIARDMHDEIGASLTRIAILSEIGQSGPADENAGEHFRKIAATAREVVDNIGEIVWAINPANDTLEDLAAYIREYASEYLETAAIVSRISFPSELPVVALSAEIRRNLFLTIKEALNNAVKYSGASELSLTLALDAGVLRIVVEDTGRGFAIDEVRRFGNGLRNMQRRMSEIGGACALSSSPGEGTRIDLRFDTQVIEAAE